MNKDQVKGRITKVEGKVKDVAGKVIGNKTLEQKGSLEKTVGQIQADHGDRKHDSKKDR
jgi:uncharacterized protein YjbJ (UPF0337 family)